MHLRNILPHRGSDESIYIFARPYFLAFLPWLAIGIALVVLGVALVTLVLASFPRLIADPLAHNVFVLMTSAYFLFILPFMTVAFIDYYYDIMVVTDRRLVDIDQNNLFSRPISELSLEQIEDVTSITEGYLSSLFDYGTIHVQTAGSQNNFEYQHIRHPREVAGVILDLSDQAKESVGQGHLRPSGNVKAVINDTIYTDLKPLVQMGAIAPEMITTIEDGSDKTAPEKTAVEPVPTAPKEPPTPPPAPLKEDQDDLDIIIDDPTASPPKK